MGNDPGHSVTATVVFAEDLAEETPDGGDGGEHSVSILDAMLIESFEDALFAQGVGEERSLAAPSRRGPPPAGVVMGISDALRGSDANPGSAHRSPIRRNATRAGIASYLHYTWQGPARCAMCEFSRALALAPLSLRHSSDNTESAPACASPTEFEASIDFRIGRRCWHWRAVNQTYGFFTRGPVISGESISLRASAVINQTAVFFTGYGRLARPTQILTSIGKETRSRNQRQIMRPSHGFLYACR